MGNWLKILKELEPISQSQKLHNKLYKMLRKAADFTPDTADQFKEEQELLSKILLAHKDFQENPPYGHEGHGDMFGRYYEETEQLSDRAGQFFTPMPIVKMMVEMIAGTLTADMPMQYLSDPAAGCGRFMLKWAETYHRETGRYNFLYNNVDIDKRMYTCCTMNAILYSIPSVNIWGDSIANEFWEGFLVLQPLGLPTQWHYLDKEAVQKFKIEFERKKQGLDHFIEGEIPDIKIPTRNRNTAVKPQQRTLFSG